MESAACFIPIYISVNIYIIKRVIDYIDSIMKVVQKRNVLIIQMPYNYYNI